MKIRGSKKKRNMIITIFLNHIFFKGHKTVITMQSNYDYFLKLSYKNLIV